MGGYQTNCQAKCCLLKGSNGLGFVFWETLSSGESVLGDWSLPCDVFQVDKDTKEGGRDKDEEQRQELIKKGESFKKLNKPGFQVF